MMLPGTWSAAARVCLLGALLTNASAHGQAIDDASARRLDAAFEYLYPVYAAARTRFAVVDNPKNPNRTAPNRVGHGRTLQDHTNRSGSGPNNDTLYSSSWLDLSSTPVRVVIPSIANRYWSVQLMDAFTNNFAMLGSRLDGAGPVEAVVVGRVGKASCPRACGRSAQRPMMSGCSDAG
jgi:hypothetical protein